MTVFLKSKERSPEMKMTSQKTFQQRLKPFLSTAQWSSQDIIQDWWLKASVRRTIATTHQITRQIAASQSFGGSVIGHHMKQGYSISLKFLSNSLDFIILLWNALHKSALPWCWHSPDTCIFSVAALELFTFVQTLYGVCLRWRLWPPSLHPGSSAGDWLSADRLSLTTCLFPSHHLVHHRLGQTWIMKRCYRSRWLDWQNSLSSNVIES